MNHPLLILDLDETLISATGEAPAAGWHFRVFDCFVTRRPHLDEFLARASDWYDLAVWSSGDDAYVAAVVSQILPASTAPRFVWGVSRCVRRRDCESREVVCLKDLKKVRRLGHDLRRILIVDDSPEKISRNYGNHLELPPFAGSPDDRALLDVLPFLAWLRDQPDFRAVEKRTWRTFSSPDGRTKPCPPPAGP